MKHTHYTIQDKKKQSHIGTTDNKVTAFGTNTEMNYQWCGYSTIGGPLVTLTANYLYSVK